MPASQIPQDKSPKQSSNEGLLNYLAIYFKGIAMGAADIVPGVSGGTIALIVGIYQRLIAAISRADLTILRIWKQGGLVKGFVDVYKYMDATFLLVLAAGIGTSFITLAGIIKSLLDNQPVMIWSLFFGLIIATVFVLLKQINGWTWQRIVLFIVGVVFAIGISLVPAISGTPSLPYLFFAGAIAICAMILPGVSGSFILVLLGAYNAVLTAIHQMQLPVIATIMAGMLCGLLAFSKILKWLLSHYYFATLSLLTGFIAGSLVKVYPWQLNGQYYAPSNFPNSEGLLIPISLILLGAVIVLLVSFIGKTEHKYN